MADEVTEEDKCGVCRRRRQAPVCGVCKTRIVEQLSGLPEAYEALEQALVPSVGGGERVSSSRTPPLPVDLDALSLRAGGSVDVRASRDQVGVLPIAVWVAAWEDDWRGYFGHSRRAGAAHVVTLTRGTRYLLTWLDNACEQYPYVVDFALSLRALSSAAKAALGQISDLEYVGRCPETLTDRKTKERSICGAAIWHDPYVDTIMCPRCRTETAKNRRVWLARRILELWPIDRRRRYHRGLIDILELPTCSTCDAIVSVEWIDATERGDSERWWRPGAVTCPNGHDTVESQ